MVIDLGEVKDISKVGAGFLQDVSAWVWMPRRVEFEFSIDGRKFTPAATIANEVAEKDYGVVVRVRPDYFASQNALRPRQSL
ncbi:MAG: hypothetical protein ABR557_12610 [Pyrinomonadaceae bacterium]